MSASIHQETRNWIRFSEVEPPSDTDSICGICREYSPGEIWVAHPLPRQESGTLESSAQNLEEAVQRVCSTHRRCLASWLAIHATCPLCRAPVAADSDPAPSQLGLARLGYRWNPPFELNTPFAFRVFSAVVLYLNTSAAGLAIPTSVAYYGREALDLGSIIPSIATGAIAGTALTATQVARIQFTNIGAYGMAVFYGVLTSYLITLLIFRAN